MTEKDDKNIRRFSRRDQKNKLDKPASLFPADDDNEGNTDEEDISSQAETASSPDDDTRFMPPSFDIDALDLPDTDSDALKLLSSLQDEVRRPNITPQEERYPPIAPTASLYLSGTEPNTTAPEPAPQHSFIYNIMSVIILICTGAFVFWFLQVWNDPQTALNPFPPNTPFVVVTATEGASSVVDLNATPDEQGQIFVVITDTPMPPAERTASPFPFVAQDVIYAPNSNDLGCNWQSVAGTVRDLNDNPLDGFRVRVTGADLNEVVFSGASQAFGDGGYELPLVGTPQEQQLTVQLFSAEDAVLSDEIPVTVLQSCDANVAIINFVQNR